MSDNLSLTPAEIWLKIREEAQVLTENEPVLARFYYTNILRHKTFSESISFHFASLISTRSVPVEALSEEFLPEFGGNDRIIRALCQDIVAHCERDPACNQYSMPFLYFKGFQALQVYRFAHEFWQQGRTSFALFLQNRASEVFGVDIHPAATIGGGIMIDHATGVVIGETATIEDNVSMLHGVTLGGSGTNSGDRHPTIRHGVLISAGAKILGNIEVGACAKIGAGSVVLQTIGEHQTAVGVPAKTVGTTGNTEPALDMDHNID